MSQQPTNEQAYLPGYKPSHITIHEWRTAENSAQYLLPTLRALASSNPHLQLLDCGAGPGTLTASLAAYFPRGRAIATDISPEVLERASANAAARGARNVEVREASVFDLPFEEGTFDVVHAQQVFCHLSEPVKALRSMLRVAKADGGIVAVRENDVRSWIIHPETPGLLAFFGLQRRIQLLEGGSDVMGTRLVKCALEAGVSRDKIRASMGTWCYSTREEREVWGGAMASRLRDGPIRTKSIENKFATAEELDGMADAWDQWIAAEDGVFGSLHGEIIITK